MVGSTKWYRKSKQPLRPFLCMHALCAVLGRLGLLQRLLGQLHLLLLSTGLLAHGDLLFQLLNGGDDLLS